MQPRTRTRRQADVEERPAPAVLGEVRKGTQRAIRLTLVTLVGERRLDLREVELLHGRKGDAWSPLRGFSVAPELLPALIRVLQDAERELRGRGLMDEPPAVP
ncbi:hypothetical protein BH23GEM7_BH23GEM7_05150 [soil metagenome]|jgi:hypothetical protein